MMTTGFRWICVLSMVFCFASRPAVAAATNEADTIENAYGQMELLAEMLTVVKKLYVEERSYEELMQGALKGMLYSLDPHSAFMVADEYEAMKVNTQGEYGGIGIHIGLRDGILTIIAPIEDTPGFRAGLQSGDRIMAVDGESTMGITMRESVSKLRGLKGAKVLLSIMSEDDSEAHDVEIVRDVIEVSSVKGGRIIRDGVAYVRITQFAAPTTEKLHEALRQLDADGMKALVLDLRSNPGGLLRESVRVAETFLKRKALVVSTRGRVGGAEKPVEHRANGRVRYVDIPLVVLINGGSASASEIVAGALQDHHRAVLVGQTSYGKGSVQSVIGSQTDKKSAIRLTTAYYYTPSDRLIHEIGIDPDLPVYLAREEWRRVQIRRAHLESPDVFQEDEKAEYADVVDRQLERAVDLLQAVLIFKKRP